jgi:hypothetical protein
MLIFDFENITGNPKYDKLIQELPKQLKNDLNQTLKINISIERFEEIRSKNSSFSSLPQYIKITGFLTDNDLTLLIDSLNIPYNYILAGRFRIDMGIIRTHVRLIDCQSRKIEFVTEIKEIEDDEVINIQERLSEKLTKDIEMHLSGRIRIGLIDFKLTGGDSTYRFLEEAIPTILATGLSVSRRFKLIETKAENVLIKKREVSKIGIFDPDRIN